MAAAAAAAAKICAIGIKVKQSKWQMDQRRRRGREAIKRQSNESVTRASEIRR